jgi:Family of unknown function (DUF5681)
VARDDDSGYPVGYKKPPRHTQFKPGQSGNVNGRPKKIKTFADAFQQELRSAINILEGGKHRRVTKLEAIAKQQTNKAVGGDAKATAMVMEAVDPRQFDTTDTLSPLLQQLHAIHEAHEATDRKKAPNNDAADDAQIKRSGARPEVDDDQA